MDAVFGDVFLIVELSIGHDSRQAQQHQGNSRHQMLVEVARLPLFLGDESSREAKTGRSQIHQTKSRRLGFAKAARKDVKVDGQNGNKSQIVER